MSGFLVTDSLVYGGGNVLAQRDALVAAVQSGRAWCVNASDLGGAQGQRPLRGLERGRTLGHGAVL